MFSIWLNIFGNYFLNYFILQLLLNQFDCSTSQCGHTKLYALITITFKTNICITETHYQVSDWEDPLSPVLSSKTVVETDPRTRALHMLGRCCTTKLHCQPRSVTFSNYVLLVNITAINSVSLQFSLCIPPVLTIFH